MTQTQKTWAFFLVVILLQILWATTLTSNEMWWVFECVLLETFTPFFVYVWLRENLPEMAEKGQLFTTVKKGKIKLVKVAGKILGYYGNLSDQGKRANRSTGEIVDLIDDELEESFWWSNFGVIWIGFGASVYEYPFEKMDIVDGEIKKIKTTAASIFLKNHFIVSIDDVITSDMFKLKLIAQLIVETKNAGLSLNFDNWIHVIEGRVRSACRDFISTQKLRDVTKEQLEKGGGLFKCVMDVNSSVGGNIGLKEQVGQVIIGFLIFRLEISDEDIKAAVRLKGVADEKMDGAITDAESAAAVQVIAANAALETAKKRADGIRAIGSATNEVLKETAGLITPKGAEELEKTKAISDAIKEHEGTLVLGGGTGLIIGDDSKKDK